MSNFEFDRVINAIEKEWFENNKQKSATQIIQTNFMTSVQVKAIARLFTHDNIKLDLAKLGLQEDRRSEELFYGERRVQFKQKQR